MLRIAKKFFSMLMNSNDVKLIKHTDIVKDNKGNDTYYFLEYFKKDPSVEKKEELNDLLKYFSVKNKKTVIRKEDRGKKYADQHEPSTQNTNFKQLFGYFGIFKIPHKQSEFYINGGFTGVMGKKFQKISTVDSTFGTGKFAADYDEEGDAKLRQQHIVQRVFFGLIILHKNVNI